MSPDPSYAVTFQTERGFLYQIDVSSGCGTHLSYPDRIEQLEGRLIYQKQ
jgi:hypothetical protein